MLSTTEDNYDVERGSEAPRTARFPAFLKLAFQMLWFYELTRRSLDDSGEGRPPQKKRGPIIVKIICQIYSFYYITQIVYAIVLSGMRAAEPVRAHPRLLQNSYTLQDLVGGPGELGKLAVINHK